MGCNVDKAKADIYDILTEDQKDFSESSIKRTEQLAELMSEKLDTEIKSKFVTSINDKNKNNALNTSKKKSEEEFSAAFKEERPTAKKHLPKELNKYNASTHDNTNNNKNENKHSALVKAEYILKDIDKANSEVSKFIKPLMRDYFNAKRL